MRRPPDKVMEWVVAPLAVTAMLHAIIWLTVSFLAWDLTYMPALAHRWMFVFTFIFIFSIQIDRKIIEKDGKS